ncbi:type II toxin-antitoxin system ParD family antitoxin [Pseudodesulfovibrio karagichevae]|uniref:Type II toxin-antitoxin system ParD family antitoxin n=1 Tax=Pseudodesulfovibrio karagichevae TaxID=3239305 RepID=A0ABV4K5G1_9BACT
MHISLTPELSDYVKRNVESGYYNNASEVIRDALRFMLANEKLIDLIKTEALQKKIEANVHAPNSLKASERTPPHKTTYYSGCHFKDRFTAQWAVFFESLGLKWKYAEESHILFGIDVTLDFQVQGHRCDFHVIGSENTSWSQELFMEVAKRTGKEIVVLVGPPQRKQYEAFLCAWYPGEEDRVLYENVVEGVPHHFGLARRATKVELCLCPDEFEYCANAINIATDISDDGERSPLDDYSDLVKAYENVRKTIFG